MVFRKLSIKNVFVFFIFKRVTILKIVVTFILIKNFINEQVSVKNICYAALLFNLGIIKKQNTKKSKCTKNIRLKIPFNNQVAK